jgi:hypothetical protein
MWTAAGTDGLYCARHDHTFSKGETCAACTTDPAPLEADDDDPVVTPDGCRSTLDIERSANKLANACRDRRAEIDRHKIKSHRDRDVIKLGELELKALRLAAEMANRREDAALVTAREKRLFDRARASH